MLQQYMPIATPTVDNSSAHQSHVYDLRGVTSQPRDQWKGSIVLLPIRLWQCLKWRPPSNLVRGQALTMWDIVWIKSRHSHTARSLVACPHRLRQALHWPCAVRKRFRRHHALTTGRANPGCRIACTLFTNHHGHPDSDIQLSILILALLTVVSLIADRARRNLGYLAL